jgi:hypothetical protein
MFMPFAIKDIQAKEITFLSCETLAAVTTDGKIAHIQMDASVKVLRHVKMTG